MNTFRLSSNPAPAEVSTLLFTAWVQALAEQRLSLNQHGTGGTSDGGRTYSFGDLSASNFVLLASPNGEWSLHSHQEVSELDIEAIVAGALERLTAGDFGGGVIYQTTLQTSAFDMSRVSMQHFMRILGDQVHIEGHRRLGDSVLLDFLPEAAKDAETTPLFAPPTDVKVTIFVPGPVASELTQRAAAGAVEIVAAICALALGRVVSVPLMVFPAQAEDGAAANAFRYDLSVPGLARDGISLDVFGEFSGLGGAEGIVRVRGALLSYHAALQQASPDVATMLLVTCLEALIVPRPEWRKDKVTKRFIDTIDELCPDVVDAVVNHANVEQALGYTRRGGARARRRQLLDQVYSLRSTPTHAGISPSGMAMFSLLSEPGTVRVALLSDLARGALLRFIQAPRSSLIGHPLLET